MNEKMFYEQKVKLKHHEGLLKVNHNTGEFKEIVKRPNNLPENKEIHFKKGKFSKFYNESLDYLLEVFKPVELKIIMQMVSMASVRSNSLKPLNDSTSIMALSETFGIHRNNIKRLLNKIKNHGIYAEFDFSKAPLSFDPNDPSTFNDETKEAKYWVLNPFIVFRGKTIDSVLVDLFRETKITKYVLTKTNE